MSAHAVQHCRNFEESGFLPNHMMYGTCIPITAFGRRSCAQLAWEMASSHSSAGSLDAHKSILANRKRSCMVFSVAPLEWCTYWGECYRAISFAFAQFTISSGLFSPAPSRLMRSSLSGSSSFSARALYHERNWKNCAIALKKGKRMLCCCHQKRPGCKSIHVETE